MKESFQDVVNRRQKAGFVGRDGQLARFRANLALPVQDPERRFVFSIHGDGGVGKTFLVRRLQQIVQEHDGVSAYLDESTFGIPEAMRAVADELARQGADFGDFVKLHDTYRRRRHEVESDPKAPVGAAAFMTRVVVKAGMSAVRSAPVVGGVAGSVDADALADQADELRKFLGAKFRRHEDATMLLSPVQVLTPVFVRDLAKAAKGRLLALFVDTYEQTGPLLDDWLRSVLDGDYGALPANIVITVAGRYCIDKSSWARYLGLLVDVPLQPFTDAEARELLAAKGVVDPRVVEVILKVSGRLPLLVAMLAEAQPADPEAVGDPSGDAVERFLKWEPDVRRRTLALAAAIPRVIDEDVLALLVDAEADPTAEFAWLRSLPFVTAQGGRWQYHDVVRAAMISLERRQSPKRWRTRHEKLAEAHREWLQDGFDDDAWENPRGQDLRLERTYHLLCADQDKALPHALNEVVDACAYRVSARWAQMIAQAGDESDAEKIRSWGRRLVEAMNATDDEADIASMTLLIPTGLLDPPHLGSAFRLRGRAFMLLHRRQEALADLDRALEHNSSDELALFYRGELHRVAGRFDEALRDLYRAVELDPDLDMAIASRGRIHMSSQRLAEALADFDRAIEINPGYAWAIANRAEIHRTSKRYGDALADFDRAIEIDPEYLWAIANRGETYRLAGRLDEALADFDRAIEIDPEYAWAIASRGQVHRDMKHHDEALADFDRAIEINPDYAWAFANRGQTRLLLDHYDEALSDFSRAIEIDPDYVWAIVGRGHVHRSMRHFDAALTDFDRAIEIRPQFGWAVQSRAGMHRIMRRYDAALADFNRAIDQDPDNARAIAGRGRVYGVTRHHDEALADFDRAIALDPDYAWALGSRAETLFFLKRYDQALADIDRARELDDEPEDGWCRFVRALVLHGVGRHGEANEEITAAIGDVLAQGEAGISDERRLYLAVYFAALGDFDQAVAHFTKAASSSVDVLLMKEAVDDLQTVVAAPGIDPAAAQRLIRHIEAAAGTSS